MKKLLITALMVVIAWGAFAQVDVKMIDVTDAELQLAGPNSVYVTNIDYDGTRVSVLLKYDGQAGATIYGPYTDGDKFLLDSFELGYADLRIQGDDTLIISDLILYGSGVSGRLKYDGVYTLNLTSWWETTAPKTNEAKIAELQSQIAVMKRRSEQEIIAAKAKYEADIAALKGKLDAQMDLVDDGESEIATLKRQLDSANRSLRQARQTQTSGTSGTAMPSAQKSVSVSSIDVSMLDISKAVVHLAGPDSAYVTNIYYGGTRLSVILKYNNAGGASIYGPYFDGDKFMLDSFDLGEASLKLQGDDTIIVSDLILYGSGVSGRLEYDGAYTLDLTSWWQTATPMTAESEIADLEAQIAAAKRSADAAVAAAESKYMASIADLERQITDQKSAMAASSKDYESQISTLKRQLSAARRSSGGSSMAAAPGASVSVPDVDVSMLDVSNAKVHLAGPESAYITNIMYGGTRLSVLLKYNDAGGASIYGPYYDSDKFMLDSFEMGYADLRVQGDDTIIVSDLVLYGSGVSGRLEYDGAYTLDLTSWWQTATPMTAESEIADLEAQIAAAKRSADAAVAAAESKYMASIADLERQITDQKSAMAASSKDYESQISTLKRQLSAARRSSGGSSMAAAPGASVSVPDVDVSMLDVSNAKVHLAGPESAYITNIMYGGTRLSVLLKYNDAGGASIYGPYYDSDKFMLDSFEMGYADLRVQGDDTIIVSDLVLYGSGVSGRLKYDGEYTLDLVSWWETMTPKTNEMVIADLEGKMDADKRRYENEIANLKSKLQSGENQIASLQRQLRAASAGAPTAAAAAIPTATVASGVARGTSLAGNWSASAGSVTQSNSSLYFAKYAIPLNQSAARTLYTFTGKAAANSTDFVGYGLHFFVSGDRTGNGWGLGNSYLVWLTRDSRYYRSEDTYIQLYRSSSDIQMVQVASVSASIDIKAANDVEVIYDKANSSIYVSVNGIRYLVYDAPGALRSGNKVAFRTLGGPVTFSNFSVKAE